MLQAQRSSNPKPSGIAALSICATFAFALVLPAALAAAAPPELIHYQGVLRDDQNSPLDGDFDMAFHFFDQPAGGNEILVDTHSGANSVAVTGGMFSVSLGGGLVTDGSAALPTDPHTLGSTFREFDEVWLEIHVEGETLLPRTRVLSAAYAQNAGALGGRAAGEYLDTSNTDQSKSGELTVGGLTVQGDINLADLFSHSIRFADGGGSQAFRWDDADHLFEATAGLQLPGPIVVGDTSLFPAAYNRFGTGSNPQSGNIASGSDLFVGDDLEAAGIGWFGSDLEAEGTARFNGEIWVDDDGPDGDQHIRFWSNGGLTEELKWDLAGTRFEFSDSLAIAGALRTGQTTEAAEGFNHLGDLDKVPDSEDMTGAQDLYVEGDVEIEESIYLGGEIFMLDLGPDLDGDGGADDIDQFIYFYDAGRMDDEWLKWDNAANDAQGAIVDRFEFSDSLHVYGDLTALNKNFVQNYPGRDDLELVYTTMEGDEATVFTRGRARLSAGQAVVPLGPTFPLVAHPDLGLSAHLTPHGSWSDLYVVELTPEELIVASRDAAVADLDFDYIVFGLRLGYEDQPAVRPRRGDAPIPRVDHWDDVYRAMPEARASSPRARYARSLGTDRQGLPLEDSGTAQALRRAIGEGIADPPAVAPRRLQDDDRSPELPSTAAAGGHAARTDKAANSAPAANSAQALSRPTAAIGGSPDLVARSFRPLQGGVAATWQGLGEIETGDVVVVDAQVAGGMRRADRIEDPTVIGIATEGAGVLFGAPGERQETQIAVALSGIVRCKVDATYGAIRPGDLLVSSATPGHGMRTAAPLPGTVIGKALESLDDGTGTILVLVGPR